jgi:hypothetical protein
VEPIAIKLKEIFGQENIFYDQWSIQPGDGIIDKMNDSLSKSRFFFFFVSKKSLVSNMVKLEWQNALYKVTKSEIKLIPVKIDDCLLPEILLQTLYIDFYSQGSEVALRQMIDVITGRNTFMERKFQEFHNLRAYLHTLPNGVKIEIRAEYFMEPQSKFVVMIENPLNELECTVEGFSLPIFKFENLTASGGLVGNVFVVSRPNPTSPGFPFVIKLVSNNNTSVNLLSILKAISPNNAKSIPVIPE